MAPKECLLAELKPADGSSDITASGEGYDENLHSLMQTFWEIVGSGQITQDVTCTICSCIILGCNKNDDTRIILAVNYPVWDLKPCTIFGSHEGTVDLKYNLIATVNHKARKMNDGHYTAVSKIPTSGSWKSMRTTTSIW
jgi:hypothetical protein